MLPAIAECLCGAWAEMLAAQGMVLRPPLRMLKTGSANGAGRKVSFLVFSREQAKPAVVLKLGQTEADSARLRHEHEALRRVAVLQQLRASVPQPLGVFPWRSGLVTVETCWPGVPLPVLWRRSPRVRPLQAEGMLRAAQAWLERLHAATHTGQVVFGGPTSVASLARQASRGQPALPEAFVEELETLARVWAGRPLPLVVVHGDFWPGNWLVGAGGFGVIDWEHSGVGTGLADAFMFLVTLGQSYLGVSGSGDDKLGAFRRTFLQPGALAEAARVYVARMLHGQGLPPEAAHLFFSLFLMEMAGIEATAAPGQPRAQPWWRPLLELYGAERSRSIFA